MKTSLFYTALLASGGLVLAGTVQAQDRPTTSRPLSSTQNVSRVAKDTLENRFTVNDLLGAGVYDHAGEKIGEITDLELSNTPGELARSFKAGEQGTMRSERDSTGARTSTQASSSISAERSSSASAERDRPSTSASMMGASASQSGSATVYISVGGLWGIGDDLVSAPLDELSYNAAEEHFVLSSSKEAIVALTEEAEEGSYAAGSTEAGPATSAGKQAFGDEASQIQNALREDPRTEEIAGQISVRKVGQSVIISGTVESESQRRDVINMARRSTSLEIEDNLRVQQ